MVELRESLESPVTVLLREDYVEWHGLPGGGPVKLAPDNSMDVTLDGYVLKIQVVKRGEAEDA